MRSFPGRFENAASVAGRAARENVQRVAAAIALSAALLAAPGCALFERPLPLRLAGAPLAVDLVERCLARSTAPRIATQRGQVYLSQHGFEALRTGQADAACTDRAITPAELAAFGDRRPEGYRIAYYGYALYVHPENPLDSVFAGSIRAVIERQVFDWKELGGTPGPIRVYGPQTCGPLGQALLRDAGVWTPQPGWTPLPGDLAIVDRVADDPAALGIAAVGYDQAARYLGVRLHRSGLPAFPTVEDIETGQYTLARVIFVYVMPFENHRADVAINFLFSAPGQSALRAAGVTPVPFDRAATNTTTRPATP